MAKTKEVPTLPAPIIPKRMMYSLKKAHSSRECAQKAYVYKIRPSLSIQATCYEINKMRNQRQYAVRIPRIPSNLSYIYRIHYL